MRQTIAQRQLKVLESAHRAVVEQAAKDGISITRLPDGSYEAATIHDGYRVHQRYFDYEPWMVAMEFDKYLRSLRVNMFGAVRRESQMKIQATLECLNSKADVYGNRYWAFRYTDNESGKQVVGSISGGESNISAIVRAIGLDWESCHYTRTELPIREFNKLTKEWQYAGCRAEDEIVPFIRKKLACYNDSNAQVV